MNSLNNRFWISTILGTIAAVTYSSMMWSVLHVWDFAFAGMPLKPPTPAMWVLGMSLLALIALGINLFFWIFIRWNGCLGWTGVFRLTLLFAILTQVPSNLGYVIWLAFPLKAAMAIIIQGFSEVFVIGLIASLFLRSSACAFSPKKDL